VKIINIIVVGAALVAGAALALPGDLVVISEKEVRPDEDPGLYYLGQAAGRFLYNGSSAALGRVAPYRVLDRDAQFKDYYIVWAPDWVKVKAADFAHLGTAIRLSENEILVGLERGLGPGALRAVEHRIELIRLEPVTPVEWRYDGEEPPTEKDPRIEGAINTITEREYAGYIKQLQYFKTRWTDTAGCDSARDYLRNFFALQNLAASLFSFPCVGFGEGHYPAAPDYIYIVTDHATLKRTRDGGSTWDTIAVEKTNGIPSSYWLNRNVGFVAGYNSVLAKTVDGGNRWDAFVIRPGYPEAQYRPYDMCFADADTGWLAGRFSPAVGPSRGSVMKTTDGGRIWVEQPFPKDTTPFCINFFDTGHGWVGEYAALRTGRIFYTTDGGATWRECSRPLGGRGIEEIEATGPNEAWATDRTSKLLHTTDGTTWQYVETGFGPLDSVEFPDRNHGYAARERLIATDDGGATWREVAAAPEMIYAVLAFADKDHGVVGGFSGRHLFKTADGGKTFVNIIDDMDLAAENVVGERRGVETPDEIIVVGGHFDSVSDGRPSLCPGADDNASGTAVAMAAARAFRNMSFKRTVRYVAFGAEESGLVGSRVYAEYCAGKGDKIVAMLNADMVCYDEENGSRDDLMVAAPNDARWLVEYLKAVGSLYGQKLIYDWDDEREWVSDDWSFIKAGYAALGVIEGAVGPGGGTDNPYYHTTEDTLDKLKPALGVRCARDLAATLAHLAGVGPYFFEPPRPGMAAVPFVRPFAVYPNPYCYSSTAGGIKFVGIKSPATAEIYDLAGRRVAAEEVPAGRDECVWRPAAPDGGTLAPGVYLYRVEGRGQREAGKLVVAK